ncbi:E3 ubiquitin-protein ligase Midline-1-like [Sinocyclocheilus grahami]|uniref:E3 ubiquitin-protein ligase Midline-1-like n=1 Tax=Sinocyclocheilus grahami TaxID=75366 RepID=UPI0007ACD261|nr:PREDICTED: E3 ubiquitin-protein ligase Midline-1-like [Sinocyclocheilus grahami]
MFAALHNLLKAAVDEFIQNKTVHLDLFLRFLLGVSLESNQRLLQDLLTHTENTSQTIRETTQYIKDNIKQDHISTERSINLFLCLLEVNDQTLYREIEEFVRSNKHSEKKLSAAHCSAIAYMLQMSEVMDEFDLKKYNTTQEGRRRLIPAVNNCRKALLADCNLTVESCKVIASALQSPKSLLRELDVSNNDLQDSGVKLISDALKNPNCQLEILRLSGCMVTDEGCCYLASAMSSNPSHLRELDLSYNHQEHSAFQLRSYQNDPDYALKILNLDHNGHFRIIPGLQKYACTLTLDPNTVNTHLILSENNRKVTRVEEQQLYPDHPERFDNVPQVLCRESLTGRCYWEAEWSSWGHIALVYRGINRKRRSDSWFGLNEHYWNLYWNSSHNSYSVWHNNKKTDISAPSPPSNRVGVYVDVSVGTLSFYSVSDTHTLTHLHTLNTTFTEPLYAGFKVYSNSSVSLLE